MKNLWPAALLVAALATVVYITTREAAHPPEQISTPPRVANSHRPARPGPAPDTVAPPASRSTGDDLASPLAGESLMAVRQQALETLTTAATTYDPDELRVIAPFLRHSDPEVRAAAIDAMIILGDGAAASILRDASHTARSHDEALAMRNAAAFLEQPPHRPRLAP